MTVESKNKPSVSEALARCCFGESENNLGESGGSLQGCAPAFCIKILLSTDLSGRAVHEMEYQQVSGNVPDCDLILFFN